MSTFLQSSFNARSAENTSSILSPGNSTQTPLGAPNNGYTGAWVPSAFYSVLQITAKADSLIQVLVEQSFLGVAADQVSDAFYNTQEDVNILRAVPFYAYITLPYMRILVSNIDTTENAVFELATKLTSTPPPQNVHVIVDSGTVTLTGPLPEGTNSIGYVRDTAYNVTAEAWQAFQIDAGNLKVVEKNSAEIKTTVESLNTAVVICDTDNVVIESGTISVDNFPATQPISGSVSVVGALPEGANSIGYVRDTAYNVTVEAWQALQIDAGNLKVVETNSAAIKTAVESLNTNVVICDTDNIVIESGTISVDNFPATQPISGTVSISGTAQVQDLPLENIAGANASRPVYNMVLGNWYRVASVGNTSGAVWIEIGAPLFHGAAIPDIGVLFQCQYLYLNYTTTGTVWDEPYNTWVADNLVVVEQNLQVIETNSASILAKETSIDAKITACNTGAVVISSGVIQTQSSGSVTTQTPVTTVPVTPGVKWSSPSTPMNNYSMVQVAIQTSATSITTSMTFGVDYSPNDVDWFSYSEVLYPNEIIIFTNGGPLNLVAPANFTSMPYVRISYTPPAMSTDTASNVAVYFLKKSL